MAITSQNNKQLKQNEVKQEITTSSNNTLLRSWTPNTTRLLIQNSSSETAFDILDHCFSSHFTSSLIGEIKNSSTLLKQLRPARTTVDIQLSNLISSFGAIESTIRTNTNHNNNDSKENGSSVVRGDSSMFISRYYRQQSDFNSTLPYLSNLISCIQSTVQHSLQPYIEFDMTQTSVQLASYPGDGQSGYIRHCDRGQNHCKHEKASNNKNEDDHSNQKERIITAIYYLTPLDWSEELDGGCLRLFSDCHDEREDDQFYDVVPYQNRLVVFRSDGVEHQVMPSLRRERMALTIWFYGSVTTSATTNLLDYRIPSNMLTSSLSSASKSIKKLNRDNINENEDNNGPPPLSVSLHDDIGSDPEILNHFKNAKIFVSIAAYRDTELGPTLKSLMTNAQYSHRIFVGVVLQVDTTTTVGSNLSSDNDDSKIWETLPLNQPWFHNQVRMITMDAKHAQGPCYARHLCQTLWRGEEYVLQIDSHMRFRKNWDTYLIQQLLSIDARDEKPNMSARMDAKANTNLSKTMLTAYPVGYTLPNTIPNETRGTLLVPWKFDNNGMLRQKGRLLSSTSTSSTGDARAIPCYLYAAGFNFARCNVIQDCPYDGELRHLFFGEEMSMAVRLYCNGYDLYAPRESVVYHLWSRTHRPTSSSTHPLSKEEEREKDKQKRASHEKVLNQLRDNQGLTSNDEHGTLRSASQFATALGVNFLNQSIRPDAELGGLSSDAFASTNCFLGVATSVKGIKSSSDDDTYGKANTPNAQTVPSLHPRAQNLISAFLGN